MSDANVIHELTVPQPLEWPLKDDEETKTLRRPLHDEFPKADSFKGNIELIFIKEAVDASLRDISISPSKKNMWDRKKNDIQHFKVSVIATDDKGLKTAPPVEMITQGKEKEHANQYATKPSKAGVGPTQRESAGEIEATEDEIFDETKVPSAPICINFHHKAMTRKRYFANTSRKTGVGSSELKSEEERTSPCAIPVAQKVDENIGESATSSRKKIKWGKKKDKQYKVLKASAAATDKKEFKMMPPVEMVTGGGGEEKEPTDTNRNKTEVAASQLEILHPDKKLNKGNKNEPMDQDVAKPSKIGVATLELASDAVRKVLLTKSLSSVQRQMQNEASFWSQPPAWMLSDISNAPMDKFNQLMSSTFPCTPLIEDTQQNDRARILTNNLKDSNINPLARARSWPLTKPAIHFAASDNQATESVVDKLKVDIADFTVKVRELDQLNARTADEAVRAKRKAETQCIAYTEELQKMEEKWKSELQLVSELKTQLEVEVVSAEMGRLRRLIF